MSAFNVRIRYVSGSDGRIVIGWAANTGFGALTITESGLSDDLQFNVESDGMGDQFVDEVFAALRSRLVRKDRPT